MESSTDGITWIPISGAWPNIIGASGSAITSPITLTVNNVGVGGTNGVKHKWYSIQSNIYRCEWAVQRYF
jgi:hypothetical protein